MHNILHYVDIRRAMNAVAAGTSDTQDGNIIDTIGYDTIAFVALFGTMSASATANIKVAQGDIATLTDAADLTGTLSGTADSGDDNKMLAVSIYKPTARYVRLSVVRAGGNVVIDGAIALLSRGNTPPALHSTVAAAIEFFNSPAAGTA